MDKPSLQELLVTQIETLRLQEERTHRERAILERTLRELQEMDASFLIDHRESEQRPVLSSTPPLEGNNKTAIIVIFREAGRSLRIRDIVERAMKKGAMQSPKGKAGVYSIVQTVLSRNSKTIFLKRGRGVWDLRERHSNKEKNVSEALHNGVHLRKEEITADSPPFSYPKEGPYTGKPIGDATEAIFKGNDNIPLTVQDILEILLEGGWTSEASNPRQSIASTLSRDPRFEKALGEGYRLRREKTSNESVN